MCLIYFHFTESHDAYVFRVYVCSFVDLVLFIVRNNCNQSLYLNYILFKCVLTVRWFEMQDIENTESHGDDT